VTTERVVLHVRLDTPVGPIEGDVQVDPGPTRLVELVPLVQSLASVLVGRALARDAARGNCVSCKAGCGACCRQLVPLSAPEAFLVADRVASLPEPRRSLVRERFTAAHDVFAAHELFQVLDGELAELTTHRARFDAVAAAYFRRAVACPFLEEESCSIHPERPITCREYNVTTPAAWCAEPSAYPIRLVPTPPSLAPALARTTAALTGEPVRLIPLAFALDWADRHAALGARTWPGVQLFETLCGELARL
jgi:Fe-S-cluster containining protein